MGLKLDFFRITFLSRVGSLRTGAGGQNFTLGLALGMDMSPNSRVSLQPFLLPLAYNIHMDDEGIYAHHFSPGIELRLRVAIIDPWQAEEVEGIGLTIGLAAQKQYPSFRNGDPNSDSGFEVAIIFGVCH